jgi:DNA-directed RNA polymerase specialized sigma24 family protein
MERSLTQDEETAIRLCHHDFGGGSIEDAAVYMDRPVGEVKQLLRDAQHKTPQMFPILTPQHRAILTMYDQHISRKAIAAALGISFRQVKTRVEFLRRHGFLWDRKPDQYRPGLHDSQIKEKF